jgi:hypothetical protein
MACDYLLHDKPIIASRFSQGDGYMISRATIALHLKRGRHFPKYYNEKKKGVKIYEGHAIIFAFKNK